MTQRLEPDFVPWYMKPDIVEGYEGWYEGKYKRADLLEKLVLSEMISQFDRPKTILEIGCGTSHFTRWFGSIGLNAVGVDLSPFMVRQARKIWQDGDLINARSSHLPFESGSFDIAIFITCFEYMPDPVGVLSEAARVSRQGLVLGLMNSWSLPTMRRKVQLAFGKNDYYRNAHFYSIREMKRLTEKAFQDRARLLRWRTTLFPKPLGLERDTGNPFGAFLGIAIKKVGP
ncbi:MAG: class I SAM-dependent methyltransferase [Nitrososphaerales archaeon]